MFVQVIRAWKGECMHASQADSRRASGIKGQAPASGGTIMNAHSSARRGTHQCRNKTTPYLR